MDNYIEHQRRFAYLVTDVGVELEFTDLSIANVRFGVQPIISVMAETVLSDVTTRLQIILQHYFLDRISFLIILCLRSLVLMLI